MFYEPIIIENSKKWNMGENLKEDTHKSLSRHIREMADYFLEGLERINLISSYAERTRLVYAVLIDTLPYRIRFGDDMRVRAVGMPSLAFDSGVRVGHRLLRIDGMEPSRRAIKIAKKKLPIKLIFSEQ
ncbi:hypothetical protein MHBO_000988 [Bonamia ostreae]|uniref:Uncharacterized protein n=1 Tax=Bonamia ostreae TaxID=126728 RepID=A0ABV2AHI2_9EUKA